MFVIPRATEKTYTEQAKNTYVFVVPKDASKQAVAKAISEQFNVTVEGVRILMRKGKATRFSRGKHAYPGTTYRQDKKIAYVTIKAGEKISGIFNEESETEVVKESTTKEEDKSKKGLFKRDKGEDK